MCECVLLIQSCTEKVSLDSICGRSNEGTPLISFTGFLSFPEGLPRIDTWVNSEVDISLYNVGNADPSSSPQSRPRLQITCCQHDPLLGVRHHKSWRKGIERVNIYLPTFAMKDHQIRGAAKQMDALVDAQYETLVHELGVGQDEIVMRTLEEAIRQADNVRIYSASK